MLPAKYLNFYLSSFKNPLLPAQLVYEESTSKTPPPATEAPAEPSLKTKTETKGEREEEFSVAVGQTKEKGREEEIKALKNEALLSLNSYSGIQKELEGLINNKASKKDFQDFITNSVYGTQRQESPISEQEQTKIANHIIALYNALHPAKASEKKGKLNPDTKIKKQVADLIANKDKDLIEFASKDYGTQKLMHREFLAAISKEGGKNAIAGAQEAIYGIKYEPGEKGPVDGFFGPRTLKELRKALGIGEEDLDESADEEYDESEGADTEVGMEELTEEEEKATEEAGEWLGNSDDPEQQEALNSLLTDFLKEPKNYAKWRKELAVLVYGKDDKLEMRAEAIQRALGFKGDQIDGDPGEKTMIELYENYSKEVYEDYEVMIDPASAAVYNQLDESTRESLSNYWGENLYNFRYALNLNERYEDFTAFEEVKAGDNKQPDKVVFGKVVACLVASNRDYTFDDYNKIAKDVRQLIADGKIKEEEALKLGIGAAAEEEDTGEGDTEIRPKAPEQAEYTIKPDHLSYEHAGALFLRRTGNSMWKRDQSLLNEAFKHVYQKHQLAQTASEEQILEWMGEMEDEMLHTHYYNELKKSYQTPEELEAFYNAHHSERPPSNWFNEDQVRDWKSRISWKVYKIMDEQEGKKEAVDDSAAETPPEENVPTDSGVEGDAEPEEGDAGGGEEAVPNPSEQTEESEEKIAAATEEETEKQSKKHETREEGIARLLREYEIRKKRLPVDLQRELARISPSEKNLTKALIEAAKLKPKDYRNNKKWGETLFLTLMAYEANEDSEEQEKMLADQEMKAGEVEIDDRTLKRAYDLLMRYLPSELDTNQKEQLKTVSKEDLKRALPAGKGITNKGDWAIAISNKILMG